MVAASRSSNADDEHDPEGATIAFERQQVVALLDAARRRLADVEAALARREAGGYGICEICGRPIARRAAGRPARGADLHRLRALSHGRPAGSSSRVRGVPASAGEASRDAHTVLSRKPRNRCACSRVGKSRSTTT